jgi:hypothetical protein
VGDDPFIKAGFEMLSSAYALAQFYRPRCANADMAKAGMEGFQEFMVKPDNLDARSSSASRRSASPRLQVSHMGRALSRARPCPLHGGLIAAASIDHSGKT